MDLPQLMSQPQDINAFQKGKSKGKGEAKLRHQNHDGKGANPDKPKSPYSIRGKPGHWQRDSWYRGCRCRPAQV